MSSELLGSAENALKGNLGGAWDILSGYADAYTDLGIGKKFGGAAAAYSLRDVGAMNGPVVRVRRDSDNAEQDFSALAVPYIPEWCNRQVIKPLDVRELNSGGSGNRDGNFVIAKAAYSLRSLGDRQAIIPNDESSPLNEDTDVPASGKYVVQVRRNVDGTIKSFTADEVTDGTLLSFVNESFTSSLPLDVQGSAAAAYSLRDLKTGGTSVTSSGDTAGDTTSNYVVQVRRSSDDTIKSFTADSITNGDLLTFVNEIQALGTVTNSVGNNGFTLTNASNTGFTATLSSGVGVCGWGYTAVSGDKITVSFDAVVRSGSPQFLPRKATALSSDNLASVTSDSPLAIPSTGSYSFEFTYDENDAGSLTFSEGDTPSDFDISNFQITAYKGAGHVATWYDQSGNSNHATQGTAGSQPKIVDAGSYLGEVDFGGTDDVLNFTSIDFSTNPWFAASVFKYDNTASAIIGGGSTQWITNIGSSTNYSARNTQDSTIHNFSSPSAFVDSSTNLVTVFRTGDTLSGSANGNLDSVSLPVIESNDTFQADRLSLRGSTYGTLNVKEVIVYNSDQSEKRRAIEESIATNYSITLASFSRNGAVRTWYDQSVSDQAGSTATGNHAVQTTTAEQPSIVSNGSLHTSGGINFDGFNDELDMPTNLISSINSASAFVVAKTDSTSDTQVAVALSRNDPDFRFYMGAIVSGNFTFGYQDSASKISLGSADTNKHLFTGIAGSSNAEAFLDGTSKGTVSSADGKSALSSGGIGAINSSVDFDGLIEEVIIYNTDQTDNRGAFEANIAEHYNISGVPAEDNQVNGFVETWYDQSGNGRDVTQTTADNQPKIVSSGALVTSNSLPAIDFTSSLTRLTANEFLTGQLNSYFVVVQIEAGDSSESQLPWRQGTNYRVTNEIKAANGNITFVVRDGAGDQGSPTATGDLANGTVRLITSLIKARGANGNTIFVDGGNEANFDSTDVEDTDFSAADSGNFCIGGIANSGGFDSHGKGSEFIFFNTDQSANRTNIESNIANHYGITLS